mgnify:CR=1 FL=1
MPIAKSTMGETVQAGVGKSSQEQERGGFGGGLRMLTIKEVQTELKMTEAQVQKAQTKSELVLPDWLQVDLPPQNKLKKPRSWHSQSVRLLV